LVPGFGGIAHQVRGLIIVSDGCGDKNFDLDIHDFFSAEFHKGPELFDLAD